MHWWTRSSRNTSRDAAFVAYLLAVVLLRALPVLAQESVESRFQRAIDLFKKADVRGNLEDACEGLKQLEREKPNDKQILTWRKQVCEQAQLMLRTEQTLFNQGVQFAKQDKCDDAKNISGRLDTLWTKNPGLRDELRGYVAECQGRQTQAENERRAEVERKQRADAEQRQRAEVEKNISRFNECERLRSDGKFDDAVRCFEQVATTGGPKAAEAQSILDSLQREEGTYEEARRLYGGHEYDKARRRFKDVIKMKGKRQRDAERYIASIDAARSQQRTSEGIDAKPAAESPADQTLRAGLHAFFECKYEEAEHHLSDYLDSHGRKQALAYFFRGAAHTTRYFLSGEKDTQQKQLALADFHTVQELNRQFQPPGKWVSPKISRFYSDALRAAIR